MPSFVCDHCQETLKKPKLDQHKQRCSRAIFTCIDCNKTFNGFDYRSHTSCISEAEKYEKSLYKGSNKKLKTEVVPVKPEPAQIKPANPEIDLTELIKKIICKNESKEMKLCDLQSKLSKKIQKKHNLDESKAKNLINSSLLIKQDGSELKFEIKKS